MKKSHENISVLGEITAQCYDQSALTFIEQLNNKIVVALFRARQNNLRGKMKFLQPILKRLAVALNIDIKKHFIRGKRKWRDHKTNVIATVGFEAIGEILAASYVGNGDIDYMALGDDNTAVAASDTTLGNEVYRNATASGTAEGNIVYLTAFFNETETDGTYEEFGNFIDGGAGANTGKLWSHIVTGGWVKTNTDALIVDCKYTFTST